MNKILIGFICVMISASASSSGIEAKKKSGLQREGNTRVSVSSDTRDLRAPYGQPVKASGHHILMFKNVFNAYMTYEYYYSLQVNNQHFDKAQVITLAPYTEKKLELESAIYNIYFNRGKYPIKACTATIETGTVCDTATLTVY